MKAEKGAVNRLPADPTPPAVWGRNVQPSAAICIRHCHLHRGLDIPQASRRRPTEWPKRRGFWGYRGSPWQQLSSAPQEHRLNREVRLMP